MNTMLGLEILHRKIQTGDVCVNVGGFGRGGWAPVKVVEIKVNNQDDFLWNNMTCDVYYVNGRVKREDKPIGYYVPVNATIEEVLAIRRKSIALTPIWLQGEREEMYAKIDEVQERLGKMHEESGIEEAWGEYYRQREIANAKIEERIGSRTLRPKASYESKEFKDWELLNEEWCSKSDVLWELPEIRDAVDAAFKKAEDLQRINNKKDKPFHKEMRTIQKEYSDRAAKRAQDQYEEKS